MPERRAELPRESTGETAPAEGPAAATVHVLAAGPLMLSGGCTVIHPDGREERREGPTALCRCGASGNKPFCDGTHRKTGFTGT
jgi:hypothetical protein